MARTVYQVVERKTGVYSFDLKDEDGVAVPSGSLTGATLTLEALESSAIVNSRSAQNVLNANNVTIDAAGKVTWTIQEADMAILDTALPMETHRATFIFSWGSGRKAPHEVDFAIENLRKVP